MANTSSRISFLSHPLFLLMVGSVIGSLLIPYFSERATRKKVLQDARLRKAVDIIDNNTRTVSQLNSLVTRLAMFHENNKRLKPSDAKLRELQEKLIEDMDSRYLEFERVGWWWYRDLNDEAVVLKTVPSSGPEVLRKDVDAYAANLLQAVNALNSFWHPCIAAEYDYKDERIDRIKTEMDEKLAALFNERNTIVGRLVADFSPEQ